MAKKSLSEKVKAVRKLGFAKGYDLRKPLSKSQRDYITRKYREHKYFIEHPKEFKAPRVGDATKKILKRAGYKVTPTGRAIIPLHGADDAKIDKGRLIFTSPGVTEKVLLVSGPEFEPRLRALMKQKLGRNEMVSIRIGNNRTIARRFYSMAELAYYVNVAANFNAPREKLLPLISVVIVEKERGQRVREKGTPVKTRKKRR